MMSCLVWITFSINGQLVPDVTTGVSNLYLGRHQRMHIRVPSSLLHFMPVYHVHQVAAEYSF